MEAEAIRDQVKAEVREFKDEEPTLYELLDEQTHNEQWRERMAMALSSALMGNPIIAVSLMTDDQAVTQVQRLSVLIYALGFIAGVRAKVSTLGN